MNLVAALIVRNEEAVLPRCFDSLINARIGRIIVNDNGSTDSTPEIIEELDMAVAVEGDWVDFAHNRNLVLDVARNYGSYVLCGIDADEELVVPEGYEWPELTLDAYNIDVHLDDLVYPRVAIVRSDFPWAWRYPVQEGLYADQPASVGNLHGIYIKSHRGEGARSKDNDTQTKDLKILEDYHKQHPDDARMTFYLAQQLKDLHMFDAAANMYAKRRGMGGYEAERWYSQFMIARCADWAGKDPVDKYIIAFRMDPSRAEPLYHVADWCRRNEQQAEAFMYAHTGTLLPRPASGLFVEQDVYEWRLLDIVVSVAWYTPFKSIGAKAAAELMGRGFPEKHRPRIVANYATYL